MKINYELFERLLEDKLEEIHWELSALESEAEELVQELNNIENYEDEDDYENDCYEEEVEISEKFLEWLIPKYVK